MKRIIIKISGQVQGVFFRSFCQEKAQDLGLTGWVKNEPDGGVFIVAEGDKKALENFINLLKKGPDSAEVSEIKINWQKSKNEFNSFEIKY